MSSKARFSLYFIGKKRVRACDRPLSFLFGKIEVNAETCAVRTNHAINTSSHPPFLRCPRSKPKTCSLPHCHNFVTTAGSFDITSVTCWNCDHGFCSTCTTKNWRTTWTSAVFSKPCLTGVLHPELVHWLFICPLCRSAFDRFGK